MCTCYMWMSQVVVRVVEPAMERVPEIVMVAIVCQSLNPSQKQVHMRYVSPPIHGEWNETLYARSPDPSALFFARRVWLARLANCMMIRFRYIAQPRGVRKTYCARSRNDVRRLTSRSNGMPSKKIMELLRTFVVVETVLRRGRIFQGSDEV